jgi:ribose transport system substrate-binding protein
MGGNIMKGKLVLSVVGFVVVFVMLGVGFTEAANIKIAMVNLSQGAPYFIGMSKAANEEATFFSNVEVITTDANGNVEKLTSDVEDVLAKKVNGIIMSAAWIEAAPAALDAIKKAGVPVVLWIEC